MWHGQKNIVNIFHKKFTKYQLLSDKFTGDQISSVTECDNMALRIRTMKCALAALALTVGAAPACADTMAGLDAWSRGAYDVAVREWQEPAKAGDPEAQFNLGQAYKLGRGVPIDLNVALDWYLKAAAQGHVQAADSCGHLLHYLQRVPEALPYLTASSERGEPRAQYLLATELFNGTYIAKDWVRAYALMTQALSAGVAPAAKSLQQMDQYIPLEQRQAAAAIVAELEQQTKTQLTARPAGTPINTRPFVPDFGKAAPPPSAGTPINTRPFTPDLPQAAPPASNGVSVSSAIAVMQAAPSTTTDKMATAAPEPAQADTSSPKGVIEPAPIKAVPANGGWVVQLGAFANAANAQKLWRALSKSIQELATLSPLLNSQGKVTRLQAGPFATKTEATEICARVQAAGRQCLIVRAN